jgi:hypothetical protein
MKRGDKRKQRDRTTPGEINAFTPEEQEAIRVAVDSLREGFPWLNAQPEQARLVAARAGFPRSIAGARQDDTLLRRIYYTRQRYQDTNIARLKIVEMVIGYLAAGSEQAELTATKENEESIAGMRGGNDVLELHSMTGELCRLLSSGEPFQPKTDAEFFSRIAEDLEYLDTQKPTPGDFAVEALQNAFVGLMQSKYAWGKKGLPTKGQVEEMAKAQLARDSREKKGGWTDLRRTAGLDFLPEGHAGRPSKPEVDENRRAKQEALTTITRLVSAVYGGSWPKFRDVIKRASGGKKVFQEEARAPTGPSPAKKKRNR